MKILLISPPSEILLNKEDVSYSLALGYLGAVLEKEGHEIKAMDMYCIPWEETYKELVKNIRDFSPNIVGINCLTMNRTSAYKTIETIKILDNNIKIVMGGCTQPVCMNSFYLIFQ